MADPRSASAPTVTFFPNLCSFSENLVKIICWRPSYGNPGSDPEADEASANEVTRGRGRCHVSKIVFVRTCPFGKPQTISPHPKNVCLSCPQPTTWALGSDPSDLFILDCPLSQPPDLFKLGHFGKRAVDLRLKSFNFIMCIPF